MSALTGDYDYDDPDGTWQRVAPRLLCILREAKALRNGLCLLLGAVSTRSLGFDARKDAIHPCIAKPPRRHGF